MRENEQKGQKERLLFGTTLYNIQTLSKLGLRRLHSTNTSVE